MDLEKSVTRRRGEVLETAILDAAWGQLVEAGVAGFTYEAIAARAGTSRPVLYRRWPTRDELMAAALRHSGAMRSVELPDTGSLRTDALMLMRSVREARADFSALLSVRAAEYFSETGTTLAELRNLVRHGARSGYSVLLEQAAARGELDPGVIPQRVVDLPMDLFRNDLMLNMEPTSEEGIVAIIDDVWLPLLRHYGARV